MDINISLVHLGTLEIIKFASVMKSKPINYVSSTSVFTRTHGNILEEESIDKENVLKMGGYGQSKW